MRHISLVLSNGLITKSGLEPSFLRVNLCCEMRLGLLVCWGVARESALNLFQ